MTAKSDRLRRRISIDPDAAASAPPAPNPVAPVVEPAQAPVAAQPAPVVEPPVKPADPEPTAEDEPPAIDVIDNDDPSTWRTCLDDPQIHPGEYGYRSFYIEDEAFARYRAAVYFTARLIDAEGLVAENMSTDVQAHMERVTAVLEEKFNEGRPFRPTPEQVRRPKRKRKATGE